MKPNLVYETEKISAQPTEAPEEPTVRGRDIFQYLGQERSLRVGSSKISSVASENEHLVLLGKTQKHLITYT